MKIIGFVIAAIITVKCFEPEKKYSVTKTVSQWQNEINVIEYSKGLLKRSNAPVNEVLPVCDSLTRYQNEIIKEVAAQMDTSKKK